MITKKPLRNLGERLKCGHRRLPQCNSLQQAQIIDVLCLQLAEAQRAIQHIADNKAESAIGYALDWLAATGTDGSKKEMAGELVWQGLKPKN